MGNIYLNEIDNIASGYQSVMNKVIDNGECAWIHILKNNEQNSIEDMGVYNTIDDYLVNNVVHPTINL